MLQVFGQLTNPLSRFNSYGDINTSGGGLVMFISNIVKVITIGAGLFAFFNIIMAGFQYVSSQGDSKQTQVAWQRIYMSLLGLVILVSAITITSILSWIFFGNWDAILRPEVYGPGTFN